MLATSRLCLRLWGTCRYVFFFLPSFPYNDLNSNGLHSQNRRDDQLERQLDHNAQPKAARTFATAVFVSVIPGKIRSVRNAAVRMIDLTLGRTSTYTKINLHDYLKDLGCWDRCKAIRDMHKGLPSGTVEHWSWMPGGSRAGVATHVIWKVKTIFSFSCSPTVLLEVMDLHGIAGT